MQIQLLANLRLIVIHNPSIKGRVTFNSIPSTGIFHSFLTMSLVFLKNCYNVTIVFFFLNCYNVTTSIFLKLLI